jgi:hypothetical protein
MKVFQSDYSTGNIKLVTLSKKTYERNKLYYSLTLYDAKTNLIKVLKSNIKEKKYDIKYISQITKERIKRRKEEIQFTKKRIKVIEQLNTDDF